MGAVGRVRVGIPVYMSHTRFCFHPATVCDGGVMGFALGWTGLGQVVDGSKSPAANVFADTMGSLEDTSVKSEIQI